MEVFVHRDGTSDIQLHQASPADTVGSLARHYGNEQAHVWAQTSAEPLPAQRLLTEIGIDERDHLHVGTCVRIAVTVRYGGDSKSKDVPPAKTIESVFEWATGPEGFNLTPDQKAKHALGICGTVIEPDRGTHVGSIATDCALCLDLAPKERFQG